MISIIIVQNPRQELRLVFSAGQLTMKSHAPRIYSPPDSGYYTMLSPPINTE